MARHARCEVSLSVVLVDDPEMHALNRQYLAHDYPTDVLSFPLGTRPLVGEVVCSVDTALREARARGHPAADELLLYLVHGSLHLLGYDDHDPGARRRMRAAERRWLRALGVPTTFGRRPRS